MLVVEFAPEGTSHLSCNRFQPLTLVLGAERVFVRLAARPHPRTSFRSATQDGSRYRQCTYSMLLRGQVAHSLPLQGMYYLHSQNPVVIHRDLKVRQGHSVIRSVYLRGANPVINLENDHCAIQSPNLLVMADYTIKVSDFGTRYSIHFAAQPSTIPSTRINHRSMLISKFIQNTATMTANVGSAVWSAPEVLRFSKYSEKADIYSFGIVVRIEPRKPKRKYCWDCIIIMEADRQVTAVGACDSYRSIR